MRKLKITKMAAKFFKTLPPKQYRQVLSSILKLCENPAPQDSKQLKGDPNYKRIDIGEYRAVYRFDKETIYIAVVGKRNDDQIYKAFKRL